MSFLWACASVCVCVSCARVRQCVSVCVFRVRVCVSVCVCVCVCFVCVSVCVCVSCVSVCASSAVLCPVAVAVCLRRPAFPVVPCQPSRGLWPPGPTPPPLTPRLQAGWPRAPQGPAGPRQGPDRAPTGPRQGRGTSRWSSLQDVRSRTLRARAGAPHVATEGRWEPGRGDETGGKRRLSRRKANETGAVWGPLMVQ